MLVQNERTGKEQSVSIDDILYVQLDKKTALNRPKTWSFRCHGFIVKPDKSYILGPGNTIFRLGYDCFTTSVEAREFGNRHIRGHYRLVELSEEERIKV